MLRYSLRCHPPSSSREGCLAHPGTTVHAIQEEEEAEPPWGSARVPPRFVFVLFFVLFRSPALKSPLVTVTLALLRARLFCLFLQWWCFFYVLVAKMGSWEGALSQEIFQHGRGEERWEGLYHAKVWGGVGK